MGRKTPLTKAVLPSNSGTQDEGEKRQTSEPKSLEGSQMQHQIETLVTKASMPNQLKQTQSGILQKSYAQVTKEKSITRSSSKKL